MSSDIPVHEVAATEELIAALQAPSARRVVVRGSLRSSPPLRLKPGQVLCGQGKDSSIAFSDDGDGVQLSTDNEITDLRLAASPGRRAIFNDTTVSSLGRVRLAGITTTGQVQILARQAVRSGTSRSTDCTLNLPTLGSATTSPADSVSVFCRARSRCGTCRRTSRSSSRRT